MIAMIGMLSEWHEWDALAKLQDALEYHHLVAIRKSNAMTDRFKKRKLTADEKPLVLYTYYVTGRGQFPLDMLRYDAAWPASHSAVQLLESSNPSDYRSVQLRSYREPTVDRWSSFLWSVGTERL